uniref:Charged multivesicular body protein 4b n=1 Tax=Panagrolaimus sp. ES5 TaxID=591445 RepID=A0AC34G5N2_9BILA
MLKNIFGGKKQAAAGPTTHESISQLRDTEDRLEKKQAYLEKLIQQKTAEARANASTDKRKALLALKQKKMHEKEQIHLDGVLSTIQFQKSALENATTNAEIMEVMATAAQAMKKANKNMDVDDIHKLMDDLADEQEVAAEISKAISTPGFGTEIDEDDLYAELKDLQDEILNEKIIDVQPIPTANIDRRLPDAPTDALPVRHNKKKEIDDMAELEQWAA